MQLKVVLDDVERGYMCTDSSLRDPELPEDLRKPFKILEEYTVFSSPHHVARHAYTPISLLFAMHRAIRTVVDVLTLCAQPGMKGTMKTGLNRKKIRKEIDKCDEELQTALVCFNVSYFSHPTALSY